MTVRVKLLSHDVDDRYHPNFYGNSLRDIALAHSNMKQWLLRLTFLSTLVMFNVFLLWDDTLSMTQLTSSYIVGSNDSASGLCYCDVRDCKLPLEVAECGCENEHGCDEIIVPNIVHYVLTNQCEISFPHLVSIRSVIKNHGPEEIFIHAPCSLLSGRYWEMLSKRDKSMIRLIETQMPQEIFGIKVDEIPKAKFILSDYLRLKIMSSIGGIYLDNDVFVIQDLRKYMHSEVTLFWREHSIHQYDRVGAQMLIGHRDARLWPVWFNAMKDYKNGHISRWWYLAIRLAQEIHDYPMLRGLFKQISSGVPAYAEGDEDRSCVVLYREENDSWKEWVLVHMDIRDEVMAWCSGTPINKINHYNETSILTLRTTMASMMRDVLHMP